MADFWKNALPAGVTLAAGTSLAGDMLKSGEQSADNVRNLAGDAVGNTAFKTYGLKSAAGDLNVGADGSMDGFVTGGGMGLDDYNAGQAAMSKAAMLAGDSTSNPAYNQANSMMTGANNLALANAGNDQMMAAMGGIQSGMSGLGDAQQHALQSSQRAMSNSMQDTGGREQDIYQRMMAMQQPGMDRATASMEARANAQGRGGISGSQYGGSGEQFANSRAQAEARNSASFGAMNQAQQEMMNQGKLAGQYGQLGQGYAGAQMAGGNMAGQLGASNAQLGQSAAQLSGSLGNMVGGLGSDQARLGQAGAGMLGQVGSSMAGLGMDAYNNSYNDANLQLGQGELALRNADMAQTGQIAGANLEAQMGLGAEQIAVNANKSASELYGNMFGAMAAPLGAIGAGLDSDGIKGIWDSVSGIFGGND